MIVAEEVNMQKRKYKLQAELNEVTSSLQCTLNCMSSTTNSSNLTQRTLDFRQKYKTQRCRYWYERGYCPFNDSCAFAHHQDELRDKQSLNQHYKTKICTNFKNYGFCKYGERCQFLHLHEAPTVYSHPKQPSPQHCTSHSQKYSDSLDDSMVEKHRKNLDLISNFGLDMLNMYKGFNRSKKRVRGERWRRWIQEGEDQPQQMSGGKAHKWREMDFEAQFPDYDFIRKPRLGSM